MKRKKDRDDNSFELTAIKDLDVLFSSSAGSGPLYLPLAIIARSLVHSWSRVVALGSVTKITSKSSSVSSLMTSKMANLAAAGTLRSVMNASRDPCLATAPGGSETKGERSLNMFMTVLWGDRVA